MAGLIDMALAPVFAAGDWLDRRRKRAKYLANVGSTTDSSWLMGGPESMAGEVVTHDNALKGTAVLACVRTISETIAQLPLNVLEHTPDGSRNKAKTHPLYWLLHRQPNPEMTSLEFREWIICNVIVYGNGYAVIDRDRFGAVTALWPLTATRVSLTRDRQSGLLWYRVQYNGTEEIYPARDILHIKGVSVGGLVGKSLVMQIDNAIGLSMAQERYASLLFSSGGSKRVALEYPGEGLSDQARKNIRQSWSAIYGGAEHVHEAAILEEGMKVSVIGVDPVDAQLIEGRTYQIAEIARAFRIPQHMVGEMSKATFSNIEQQALEFVKYCIAPWIERLEQRLDMTLIDAKERGRIFCKFSLDGLLRGDTKARTDYYTAMLDRGVYSPNMVLALEDQNPIGPAGDLHMVPLNMIPIEQAAQGYDSNLVKTPTTTPTPEPKRSEPESRDSAPVGRTRGQGLVRRRLRDRYRSLIADAAERVVRGEVRDLRKALKRSESRAAVADGVYGDGFRDFVKRQMAPVMSSLAEAIAEVAREESGGGADFGLTEWIAGYVERFAQDHEAVSLAMLDGLSDEDVDAALDEWIATRPQRIANHESRNLADAVAAAVFGFVGLTYVWRASGDSCPLCRGMDGKVVGKDGVFLAPGSEVAGGEGKEPMVVKTSIRHAPLHDGCDCTIEAR